MRCGPPQREDGWHGTGGTGGGRDRRATTGLGGALVGAAPVVTSRGWTDSGPGPEPRARRVPRTLGAGGAWVVEGAGGAAVAGDAGARVEGGLRAPDRAPGGSLGAEVRLCGSRSSLDYQGAEKVWCVSEMLDVTASDGFNRWFWRRGVRRAGLGGAPSGASSPCSPRWRRVRARSRAHTGANQRAHAYEIVRRVGEAEDPRHLLAPRRSVRRGWSGLRRRRSAPASVRRATTGQSSRSPGWEMRLLSTKYRTRN